MVIPLNGRGWLENAFYHYHETRYFSCPLYWLSCLFSIEPISTRAILYFLLYFFKHLKQYYELPKLIHHSYFSSCKETRVHTFPERFWKASYAGQRRVIEAPSHTLKGNFSIKSVAHLLAHALNAAVHAQYNNSNDAQEAIYLMRVTAGGGAGHPSIATVKEISLHLSSKE